MTIALGEDQTLVVDVLDEEKIQIVTDFYLSDRCPAETANAFDAKHRRNRIAYLKGKFQEW